MSNANQNNENQKLAQQPNDKEQIGAADAPTMAFPAGFQAIATAYGDYTKKSFEDTKSFVEKPSGVKSFDKVVEIQTDFAKSAFETFVAESQKNRRAVQRSCEAILQAVRWLCRENDSDKSIGLTRHLRHS